MNSVRSKTLPRNRLAVVFGNTPQARGFFYSGRFPLSGDRLIWVEVVREQPVGVENLGHVPDARITQEYHKQQRSRFPKRKRETTLTGTWPRLLLVRLSCVTEVGCCVNADRVDPCFVFSLAKKRRLEFLSGDFKIFSSAFGLKDHGTNPGRRASEACRCRLNSTVNE